MAAAFAAITTLATFLSAKPAAFSPPGRGTNLDALSAAGGATEAFRIGTGFLGVLVIVTFAARTAMEFSHGTMRTLLVHEPRRWRIVTGKTLALFIYAAGILAMAAVFTVAMALALAPGQNVSTTDWLGFDGARAAAGDYLSAAAGLLGWAILGSLLGVVFRSVPVVVAVGVAWAGPFEHLLGQAWSTAIRSSPACRPRPQPQAARSTCPTRTRSPSHSSTARSPRPLAC
jgi:ABC-type transport system involved in multi-copper enzyme maturation permease subunit